MAAPKATFALPPVLDSLLRLVLTVDSARFPCGHDIALSISLMDPNPQPMLAWPFTPIHAPETSRDPSVKRWSIGLGQWNVSVSTLIFISQILSAPRRRNG